MEVRISEDKEPGAKLLDRGALMEEYKKKLEEFKKENADDLKNMVYSRSLIHMVRDIVKVLKVEPCPLSEEVLKSFGIDRGTMPAPARVSHHSYKNKSAPRGRAGNGNSNPAWNHLKPETNYLQKQFQENFYIGPENGSKRDRQILAEIFERKLKEFKIKNAEDFKNKVYSHSFVQFLRSMIKVLDVEPCPLSEEELMKFGIDRGTMPAPLRVSHRSYKERYLSDRPDNSISPWHQHNRQMNNSESAAALGREAFVEKYKKYSERRESLPELEAYAGNVYRRGRPQASTSIHVKEERPFRAEERHHQPPPSQTSNSLHVQERHEPSPSHASTSLHLQERREPFTEQKDKWCPGVRQIMERFSPHPQRPPWHLPGSIQHGPSPSTFAAARSDGFHQRISSTTKKWDHPIAIPAAGLQQSRLDQQSTSRATLTAGLQQPRPHHDEQNAFDAAQPHHYGSKWTSWNSNN